MENLWLYPTVYLAMTSVHLWQWRCISCLATPHQVILALLLKLQPGALSKCPFHFDEHLEMWSGVLNKKFLILCVRTSCGIAVKHTDLQFFPNEALKIPTSIKQRSSSRFQHKVLLLFVFHWVSHFLDFDFGAACPVIPDHQNTNMQQIQPHPFDSSLKERLKVRSNSMEK